MVRQKSCHLIPDHFKQTKAACQIAFVCLLDGVHLEMYDLSD